jgi:hypothetical protein
MNVEDVIKTRHSELERRLQESRDKCEKKISDVGGAITGSVSGYLNDLKRDGETFKANVKLLREIMTDSGIQFEEKVPLVNPKAGVVNNQLKKLWDMF